MAKKITETPLMKQHRQIKSKYPDAVLLFRVGDFYETFGNDAVIAAKVLGITLTKRSKDSPNAIDLAGFPHHSLDTYLHKLVKAGYRVAICDQLEDPKKAVGIVKRGVTEIVTPGVAINDKLLDNNSNNFLACLYLGDKEEHGVAFIDISTGECLVAEGDLEYMDKLLQSFQPSEVLLAKGKQRFFKENLDQKYYTFCLEDWVFQHHYAYESLVHHFDVQSLKGFGIEDWQHATIAAGGALHYLKDTAHPNLEHVTKVERITRTDFLWMDRFTIRNLELIHSPQEDGYTLLQTIDQTATSMGARLMKRWLIFPLNDLVQIKKRQEWVHYFILNTDLSIELTNQLKQIGDLERLVAKIPLKRINPREVLQLGKSLHHCQIIQDTLLSLEEEEAAKYAIAELMQGVDACVSTQEMITKHIKEDAAVAIHKGGCIKDGVSEELDQLREISYKGKEYLAKIQQEESKKTGIPSLKIAYNNVFGYYLEVTNTHKDKVPENWVRKQTLTNAERYITPELKEYEEKILGAEDKMLVLEQKIYTELLEQLQLALHPIQHTAQAISRIDCLLSFAHVARRFKYTKPTVSDHFSLEITQGRHPVIEKNLPLGEEYIANDLYLDKDTQQIIILTGPNMSGKSALLRQTAIITLMAHMGSFVPADKAEIGLTDKIFTRVGASDNLSGGESTFMVEMNETASIVNNISNRSLILLDEIGRGTSTYDGISLAWSIVEFIANHPKKPKTLFATHYHELNELENKLETVKNFHITHKEIGNKVIFLRKLAKGGSTHSFGIQVARMAGMPLSLTERASEILSVLEKKNAGDTSQDRIRKIPTQTFQLSIFDGLAEDLQKIKEILQHVEINKLTPVEALMKLNELKEIVKSES